VPAFWGGAEQRPNQALTLSGHRPGRGWQAQVGGALKAPRPASAISVHGGPGNRPCADDGVRSVMDRPQRALGRAHRDGRLVLLTGSCCTIKKDWRTTGVRKSQTMDERGYRRKMESGSLKGGHCVAGRSSRRALHDWFPCLGAALSFSTSSLRLSA